MPALAGVIEAYNYFKRHGYDKRIDEANDYILWLNATIIVWKTPLKEAAETIQKYLDYRSPTGKPLSVAVHDWLAQRLLNAGMWNNNWIAA